MRFTSSLAAIAVLGAFSVSAAPAAAASAGCTADNVLRHLRATERSSKASTWCSTYTATPATVGQAYPTWLSPQYTTSTSRLSSACTCLNGPATSAASSLSFGSYIPPNPTSTAAPLYTHVANPLPTITGAPLALKTAPVSDSIPPATARNVFFGNLAMDNATAFIAQVNYKALDNSPLVNLDDLLDGLDGFPVCGTNSITLKFTTVAYRDLAVSTWSGKTITLVTAGGNYCGEEGTHNFFRVSAVSSSNASGVILTVSEVELRYAISSLEANYGTFDINADPNTSTIRRDLKARGWDDFLNVFVDLGNDIKNAFDSAGRPIKKFSTSRYDYSVISNNLFQINEDGRSANVGCDECGITGGIQLFGSVSADVKNWQTVGLVLGFDLVDPTFNLKMDIGWSFEWEGSQETPLFSVVPWSIEIPKILTIRPAAELIAAVDLHVKSAFQIRDIGFYGKWDTFSVGYNLITKLPVLYGSVVPDISYYTPRFANGISLWGAQEAQATVWLGPRVGMEVNVLNGLTQGHADVTVEFPAVNAEVKLDSLSKCPGASGNDMCVRLHGDALIRGTASAGAGLVGIADVSVEHEIFRYNLGTFLEQNFLIDV